VQLGGGLRDLDLIERYIDDGVRYVVIGTAAVKNPGFPARCLQRLRRPCHRRARRQRRQGRTTAWSKLTGHDVLDLALKFEDYGVDAILYTTSAVTAC